MSLAKQFTLFSNVQSPNGWKVAFALAELGLPYAAKYLDFNKNEQTSPEFTKYNPNGRIPALVDHANNDFVVWESDAILVYLVEKYDPEHKISASTPKDKITQLQWLFFQASGQGPYFGQAGWFLGHHHEKLPSAIERYQNEIVRVFGVLESVLSKQEWLVAGKPTIADLSFVPWNIGATDMFVKGYKGFDLAKDFPSVHRWHTALLSRKSVQEQFAIRQSLLEKK